MLTDNQLKKAIKEGKVTIEPYNEKMLKAGKYDIHLGKNILIPIKKDEIVDPTNPETQPKYEKLDLDITEFILLPGELVLGQTQELIGLGPRYGMFLDGSTTLARIGLTIHQTANYIPPGQDPHIITLEIFNSSPWKIKLTSKMRIGKVIAFEYSEENSVNAKDYNRYNAQNQTTGAIFKDNNDS